MRRWGRWFWIYLGGVSLFSIGYILYLSPGLFPDETYFWDLSRRPQLGYVEKPPLVNYLIWATTRLLGSTELGVRLGAVVCFALFSWITYAFGRQILPRARDAFLVALLLSVAPMPTAARVIITPDSLLMVTWGLSVWGLYQALLGDGRSRWWCLAAVGLAMGFMAKFTIAFIVPCLALFLLSSRRHRAILSRPAPYLAVSGGLLGLLPSLVWNAQNDWSTLRHMRWNAQLDRPFSLDIRSFLEFTGSQFVVLSPLLFVGLVSGIAWAGLRALRGGAEREAFLFWFSAPILGGFLLKSLQGNTLANWAAVAYFTGGYAMALLFRDLYGRATAEGRRRLRRWAIAAYALAALFTLLAHDLSGLATLGMRRAVDLDPMKRAIGWRELGQVAGRAYETMAPEGPTVLLASRYQITSELAFYVPGQPRVYNINWGRRENQYDRWDDFRTLVGSHAIFVEQGDLPSIARLDSLFSSCETLPPVKIYRYGMLARSFSLFGCRGFKETAN